MKALLIPFVMLGMLASGCVYEPIHQGNRMDKEKAAKIEKGMTKFAIEQILGSPSLDHVTRPNKVTYYEAFEEDGDLVQRRIEITYDEAFRAQEVKKFGFEADQEQP